MRVRGNRWASVPPPQPDELMSSWLHRLARANGRSDHTLCSMMFGAVPLLNRDLDLTMPVALLPVLSKWTGISEYRLSELLLTTIQGKVTGESRTGTVCRWVLPLGVYHRVRRHHGLQYCPQCLAEPIAYARKQWRYAFVTECLEHERPLFYRRPDARLPSCFTGCIRIAGNAGAARLAARPEHARCQCRVKIPTATTAGATRGRGRQRRSTHELPLGQLADAVQWVPVSRAHPHLIALEAPGEHGNHRPGRHVAALWDAHRVRAYGGLLEEADYARAGHVDDRLAGSLSARRAVVLFKPVGTDGGSAAHPVLDPGGAGYLAHGPAPPTDITGSSKLRAGGSEPAARPSALMGCAGPSHFPPGNGCFPRTGCSWREGVSRLD